MIWPAITVMIITYKRPIEIRKTIKALRDNIKYPGKIFWHIADDSSGEDYIPKIKEDFPELTIFSTTCDRGGWGKNFNTAFKQISTEFIFVCEDDYVAKGEVDIHTGIALMQLDPSVALVRYDGVAGHDMVLELKTRHWSGGRDGLFLHYATIRQEETELYAYSNRPHLIHKHFHEHFGLYPEDKKLGETEETFAHIVKALADEQYRLAILDTGFPPAFDHIGHSYQLTEEDK